MVYVPFEKFFRLDLKNKASRRLIRELRQLLKEELVHSEKIWACRLESDKKKNPKCEWIERLKKAIAKADKMLNL